MSAFEQQLLNQQMDREEVVSHEKRDEENREQFSSEDEQRRYQAFRQGGSFIRLYEELQKEGLEDGDYKVTLRRVTPTVTSGGKPTVRFMYRLEDNYEFRNEELPNVHVNSSASNEWNEQANTNYAIRTLGDLFAVLGLRDPDMSATDFVQHCADILNEFVENNDKPFEAKITCSRPNLGGRQMIFYRVDPKIKA